VVQGNHHYTPKGIEKTKTFPVNIPSSHLREKTGYCGPVSGEHVDTSEVFDLFYGSLKTASIIRECPVSPECLLVTSVPMPATMLFIGEIMGAYADPGVMTNGKPDVKAIYPLGLTVMDNTCWKPGEPAGNPGVPAFALKKGKCTRPHPLLFFTQPGRSHPCSGQM